MYYGPQICQHKLTWFSPKEVLHYADDLLPKHNHKGCLLRKVSEGSLSGCDERIWQDSPSYPNEQEQALWEHRPMPSWLMPCSIQEPSGTSKWFHIPPQVSSQWLKPKWCTTPLVFILYVNVFNVVQNGVFQFTDDIETVYTFQQEALGSTAPK